MASDPLLNENFLCAMLDPDNDITIPAMLSTFYLCAISCFDRKVEREFFAEILDIVRQGVCLATKMECGANIYQILKDLDPERQPTELLKAMEGSVEELQAIRKVMLHKMELIMQCPTTSDKIS